MLFFGVVIFFHHVKGKERNFVSLLLHEVSKIHLIIAHSLGHFLIVDQRSIITTRNLSCQF